MNQPSVGHFFDALTSDYSEAIERCFPRYREMLWAVMAYLPDRKFTSILDIGCGTGNLSVLIRQAYPGASLECVDLSADSLEVCEQRLQALATSGASTIRQADFAQLDYEPGRFDLIVSNIAIHHVPAAAKQRLFGQIQSWLEPGGLFTYADQFRGASEDVYQRHIGNWRDQSFAAGGTAEEFEMWMEHQREHDHHDTLADQFHWLESAGLRTVDATWRYLLWAVVQASK